MAITLEHSKFKTKLAPNASVPQRTASAPQRSACGVSNFLRYSTAALHFTIDAGWRILNFTPEVAEQFSSRVGEIKGTSFREALLCLNASWDSILPTSTEQLHSETRIFLPWSSIENHGMGWSIQALSHESVYFISLLPILSPDISPTLSEDQLSMETNSMQASMRQLFLRAQQQETRFRYFIRHLPGAYFTQDDQLGFTFLNDSLEKLLGRRQISNIRSAGARWWDWVHPSDSHEFERNIERCRVGCVPVSFRFRLMMPGEDRILYLLELRIPVRGIDGRLAGYEGIWLDLTRETMAEQRLQHASWKESLAEVSGSLSHDFNNTLGGLCGMSDLVYSSMDKSDANQEMMGIIRDTALHAKDLIQRIISLNREKSGHVALHDMRAIVGDQKELIRIILPKDTSLQLTIPDKELPVRIDAVALRRILINFATNSRDALGEKGKVHVELREVNLDACDKTTLYSAHCPEVGPAVELVFRDNGTGIEPATLNRIFGAYFSTKETTRGSGLGLYTLVHSARENRFDYGVSSQVGVGTEMRLLIPLETLESEEEEEVNEWPNAHFDTRIAVYGRISGYLENLVSVLAKRELKVEHISDESALRLWGSSRNGHPRVLITSLCHMERDVARRRCRDLGVNDSDTLNLLSLQGLNPDHFSDFMGSVFDGYYTSDCDVNCMIQEVINHVKVEGK